MIFDNIKRPYQGVFNIVGLYWKIYGGWRALVFSPYFHFSVVLTASLSNFWLNKDWWDVSISVLPSIIGFALGGYAVWLGFGDEKFRSLISEMEDSKGFSPYLEVSATFAHFIIIQLAALFAALIAKASDFPISDTLFFSSLLEKLGLPANIFHHIIVPISYCIGFLLFVYALMTAIAATLAVFRIAHWFDTFRNLKKADTPSSPNNNN